VFFVPAVGWDEHYPGLADCFLRCVSEKPLRALVPTGDDAVDILADDRVIGGFHDRGQCRPRPLRLRPLNQVGGLSCEHIHQAQLAFGRVVRLAPVSRYHPDQPARAGHQWRGLHGADASLAVIFQRRSAGHEVTLLNIGHDDALAGSPCHAARCFRVGIGEFKDPAKGRVEPAES